MNQIYDVSPDALSNLLLTLYFDIVLFDGRLPALYAPVTAVPLGEPPIRNLTLVWAADIFAWRDSPVWNTPALRVAGKHSGGAKASNVWNVLGAPSKMGLLASWIVKRKCTV